VKYQTKYFVKQEHALNCYELRELFLSKWAKNKIFMKMNNGLFNYSMNKSKINFLIAIKSKNKNL
jgi:hypothetical protein